MAQTSHIKRRGAVYYAQLAVPLDVQATIGRKTMDRSLKTKDASRAKELLPDVLKEWHCLFRQARNGTLPEKPPVRQLTPAQVAAIDYQNRIEFDAELRATDHRYAQFDVDPDQARRFRDGYSGRLSDDQLEELVGDRIGWFRRQGNVVAEKGSPEWRAVAQALCVSVYEAMGRAIERGEGDFTGSPTHPLLANAEPQPEAAPAAEGILELFGDYQRENAKGLSADTLNQARRDVTLFGETVGNPPATKITKAHVRAWKKLLIDYPVRAAEITEFRALTMKQVIEANQKLGKPKIGARTVNRYLAALGAFCDRLVRNGYLEHAPGRFRAQLRTDDSRASWRIYGGFLDRSGQVHSPAIPFGPISAQRARAEPMTPSCAISSGSSSASAPQIGGGVRLHLDRTWRQEFEA